MTAPRKPTTPPTARETIRKAVMALLTESELSAKEISMAAGIPEKEVYSHLEHIRRSVHATGALLEVSPAECRACGFVFAKRHRMTPPSRCPVCRDEAILDPHYRIRRLPGG